MRAQGPWENYFACFSFASQRYEGISLIDVFNLNIMAKYSKKASLKVEEAMHEMKKGNLKTGSGKKVTKKQQAIAIGLSEAKKEGAKVPDKK